jgi:LysR family hydrogen peroxide-inducible transcriptional activator
MGIALLPEMAVKGGLLNGTSLVARPLAPPAPKRVIALVARSSTAHLEEFQVFSDCIEARFKRGLKSSRGAVKGLRKD